MHSNEAKDRKQRGLLRWRVSVFLAIALALAMPACTQLRLAEPPRVDTVSDASGSAADGAPVEPEGWRHYEHDSGDFGFYYPDPWRLLRFDSDSAQLRRAGPEKIYINVVELDGQSFSGWRDNVQAYVEKMDDAMVDLWAQEQDSQCDPLGGGIWEGQIYQGIVAEYEVVVMGIPSRIVRIWIPRSGAMVDIVYALSDTRFSQDERQMLTLLADSIHLD